MINPKKRKDLYEIENSFANLFPGSWGLDPMGRAARFAARHWMHRRHPHPQRSVA
jgi:hypothetical protein